MLSEGWDVLNLYDIVRLYETRDAKHGKAGVTTVSEAQLIGRGARYYPFVIEKGQDMFKRKYDEDINNELRVLEELHYHSLNDSRYINEIKAELIKSGITSADDRRRQITVSIKESIKNTQFWKRGFLFINEQRKNNREQVKRMRDLVSETIFKHYFKSGKTIEIGVFVETTEKDIQEPATEQKTIKLNQIDKNINRKALDKVDFYKFSNLKSYFPSLKSINEFLTSNNYLGEVDIEIYGLKDRLNIFSNYDKYQVSLDVLNKLANKIKGSTTEYIGTKEFRRYSVHTVVKSPKTSEILVGGDDKELGIAISETNTAALKLCLKDLDWYMYDDNYGTSEEKYFIHFIKNAVEDLRKKYKDIYLLRNEHIFKIYRFSDGKAIEPDFVLFLTEKKTKKELTFQLFIEAKGQHLLKTDQWKEDFLKQIEKNYKIVDLLETDRLKLVGLPFYNEVATKKIFIKSFIKILKIRQ